MPPSTAGIWTNVSTTPLSGSYFFRLDPSVRKSWCDNSRSVTTCFFAKHEDNIDSVLQAAGPTLSAVNVHLPKDRITGNHQGYAFVEFLGEEDADYAIKIMNMIKLYGKPIRVNKVRNGGCYMSGYCKKPHMSTPLIDLHVPHIHVQSARCRYMLRSLFHGVGKLR